GELATEEVDVMLNRFTEIFAHDASEQKQLQQELRDYLMQNVPLQELVPKLQTPADKELVLRLGYEVIRASARTPEEAAVNQEEAAAYQTLKQLLDLPEAEVQRIESEVEEDADASGSLIDVLTQGLRDHVGG
ncbi:MAG: TerB family tellurite resistance protein, partial [Synechococcales bacterium]|nr:TerB family tellurite resistance protein [Synechococcales bacterium]